MGVTSTGVRWEPIRKSREGMPVPPNLLDYDLERRWFTWEGVAVEGLPGGAGLNLAHEAVDRHGRGPLRDKVAVRFLGVEGCRRDWTFGQLMEASSRLAHVLEGLPVARGEAVFTLLGRRPELFMTALGSWKRGAVFCPLFSAFGPEPLFQRLNKGQARVLVTDREQYLRKVLPLRERLPDLHHVLLVDGREAGTSCLSDLVQAAPGEYRIPPTDPEDPASLHFTSGTTGMPKGALHVHGAVRTYLATGRYALDLHPGDIFWCTADPGWVTGTSYAILAPLLQGVTSVVDEAEFEAERWLQILARERVTVWYTAPTALRRLVRAGRDLRLRHDLGALRFVASVGEPLNPEVVVWGVEALGQPVHDNWWQTETGGIMIANLASAEVRPGSMGRPLPGVEAAVVRRGGAGLELIEEPGVEGELALRAGWPSMFRGYLGEPERYQRCFLDGWYLTGDRVRRDADGYYWFVGRGDDLIKSSGHLIGPFEVESALMEHPAVVEAAVIGKPDPVVGEVVKAFICLRPGREPSEALRRDLLGFGRRRLGPAVAPKEIEFLAALPKTRSGKIVRRLLKARELGLPEGDLSTLEEGA